MQLPRPGKLVTAKCFWHIGCTLDVSGCYIIGWSVTAIFSEIFVRKPRRNARRCMIPSTRRVAMKYSARAVGSVSVLIGVLIGVNYSSYCSLIVRGYTCKMAWKVDLSESAGVM